MMHLPDIPGFPHLEVDRGRVYRVDEHTDLAAFHVETPLGQASAGFIVYAFVRDQATVGRWDWTAEPAALERIARTFRETTSGELELPPFLAPGGELAQLRPAVRDLLARAIEEARPGPKLEGQNLDALGALHLGLHLT